MQVIYNISKRLAAPMFERFLKEAAFLFKAFPIINNRAATAILKADLITYVPGIFKYIQEGSCTYVEGNSNWM